MLSYFLLPRFQPLAFLLLSISFFGVSPAALSLTPEETKAFSTNYLQACLQGMQQFNLDLEKGEKYCQCTLTSLLELPDEKLRSLATLSEQQLTQDPAIQAAVKDCLVAFTQ